MRKAKGETRREGPIPWFELAGPNKMESIRIDIVVRRGEGSIPHVKLA